MTLFDGTSETILRLTAFLAVFAVMALLELLVPRRRLRAAKARRWAPAVDIYEQDGNIVMKAELPGVDPKDVDVRLENNTLTLSGQRRLDSEVKQENYHRVERAYGTFTRSFTLPSVVDQGHIKAEYKDGVLKVTLPKREEAKPKQINIAVGS